MKPQAVIFDIGNVLIEWQPERYYDRIIGQDRREAMFAEVDLHGMNDVVDRGGDFTQTVMAWIDRYPHWADEIRHWHDKWIDLATPEISHSVRLMRALRQTGTPVFALTNFGIGTFDIAQEHYPFLNEFDRRYISGHMKTAKPDDLIYQMVEEDCGVDPHALLFADDRAENIDRAAQRGWQTHLFETPQGWADRLVAAGLLSESEAA